MFDILRLSITDSGSIDLKFNSVLLLVLLGVLIAIFWLRKSLGKSSKNQYEIDEVEIGVGSGKVKIKPNYEDLQIAYKLWVELKTRKLGLPFDEDHDVILEVYNSWYEFFKITRELIKSVPVNKIRSASSTQVLVGISIDVLNKGIRPHLSKWQARYRHWIDAELGKQGGKDFPPQDLQKRYPKYGELVSELKATNKQLVAYSAVLARILGIDIESAKRQK